MTKDVSFSLCIVWITLAAHPASKASECMYGVTLLSTYNHPGGRVRLRDNEPANAKTEN